MGQTRRMLTPGRSPSRQLGARLRAARMRAGLSQRRLGDLVFYSGSTIGRVEKAERAATRVLIERCDDALGQGG
jgi:transcriptional regulator with XRE-family HTH domain